MLPRTLPCPACGAEVSGDAACRRCGASGPIAPAEGSAYPAPGTVIQKRWELRERTGASLLGPWYRALDRVEGTERLLRGLPARLLREELTLTRLVADTRQALAIDEPSIRPPYQVVLAEPWAWLVEPLPAGEPLAGWLGPGAPLERAVRVLDRLVELLRYAHLRQAVHGALTLDEAWVGPDGSVELRGFGQGALLARVLSVDEPPAAPLAPPEVHRGETPKATSDVYGLGAVGYALLTGGPPFAGGDVPARIKHERPPDAHQARPEVPVALAGVVRRALSKAPEERFPSAGDMLVALRLATRAIRS